VNVRAQANETRPFLRWAGSKRKLLPQLTPYWGVGFKRYIEPFVGSAALFFSLRPPDAILSDINPELVQLLEAVRDHPQAVHKKVTSYPRGKRTFYQLRNLKSGDLTPIERAARLLFLNRFCFNGLYRTNLKGDFNVPFSPEGTGSLPLRRDLLAAAKSLRRAELRCGDFEGVIFGTVRAGDFVYMDPPYAVSNRRIFRQYGPQSFGLDDLGRLSAALVEINRRKARFVLTYADCREARRAFAQWDSRRVYTQRNISGFARHRRRAAELVFTNSACSQ
jgi:DNA adenine methylase